MGIVSEIKKLYKDITNCFNFKQLALSFNFPLVSASVDVIVKSSLWF